MNASTSCARRQACAIWPTFFLFFIVVAFSLSVLAEPFPSAIDLAGKSVDPLHATPGKVVVLVFVRTDCPVSNRYALIIQQMSKEYGTKAAFWLVYPDRSESAQAVSKHLHDYGYTIPALRDPQRSLVKLGEVEVTPEAAVFTADGTLIYHGRIDNWYEDFGHARSAPTTHELNDAIQSAISGSKAQLPTASAVGCYISDLP